MAQGLKKTGSLYYVEKELIHGTHPAQKAKTIARQQAGSAMTPLISFVIATHNRPDHLVRAIASVIAQGAEVELIVVADEGSAGTRSAAAHTLREGDTFLSRPGLRGPSESRNLGRDLAQGQWLCFLDDDDTITPDYLAQVRPHLDRQAVIYGNRIQVQDKADLSFGEEVRHSQAGTPPESIEVENFIPVGTFFVPMELARQVAFDPHLPTHEDWDYLLGLLARAPLRHVDIWGARYHRPPDPTRNTLTRGERSADYLAIYRRHRASSDHVKRQRAQRLTQMGIALRPRVL
ncbi:MAG: hypothetical protein CSA72_00255 [Rhodobacterales bacterium]|nr:MAG: hypothetical protein CSA72_00255 [Rhodobacterales bacterium]